MSDTGDQYFIVRYRVNDDKWRTLHDQFTRPVDLPRSAPVWEYLEAFKSPFYCEMQDFGDAWI